MSFGAYPSQGMPNSSFPILTSRDSLKNANSASQSQATTIPVDQQQAQSRNASSSGVPRPRSSGVNTRNSGLVSPNYLQLLHESQRNGGSVESDLSRDTAAAVPYDVPRVQSPGTRWDIDFISELLVPYM